MINYNTFTSFRRANIPPPRLFQIFLHKSLFLSVTLSLPSIVSCELLDDMALTESDNKKSPSGRGDSDDDESNYITCTWCKGSGKCNA